jgi:Mrp family chromosome partitioning ATPase
LSNDRLQTFIESALSAYDHVIVDSPPVLDLSDAPSLARAVEGCVFVTEAGGVSVRGVKRAVDRLKSAHVHVFGAVVTKFDDGNETYGYAYGYDYGDDSRASKTREPA